MAKKIYTPKERVKKINEYNKDYKKTHYRAYSIQISIESNSDVIAKLDSVPNKVNYLVSLIRADIEKNGINND